MATTIYKFRPHENLTVISKRYHTDIKTLTTLNSWLINPHTGKTEMFPAKIKYIYKQNNSVTQRIALEKPAKPGTVKVTVYQNADHSGKTAIWADDRYGKIKTMNGTGEHVYSINYKTRELTAENLMSFQNNWKSLTIEYEADLLKDYLIVPLIGNGNTSIEDYWENVDKVTGISLNRLMTSLATDDSQLLSASAVYAQTDNGSMTQATVDLVGTALLDVDTNSGEFSGAYDSADNSTLNSGNQNGLYIENTQADFTTARVGGIVQTAINEGSKNMRDYFLYDIEHKNNGAYSALDDPYKSDDSFSTTALVRDALNKSTAGNYTAALYAENYKNIFAKNRGPLNFHRLRR